MPAQAVTAPLSQFLGYSLAVSKARAVAHQMGGGGGYGAYGGGAAPLQVRTRPQRLPWGGAQTGGCVISSLIPARVLTTLHVSPCPILSLFLQAYGFQWPPKAPGMAFSLQSQGAGQGAAHGVFVAALQALARGGV